MKTPSPGLVFAGRFVCLFVCFVITDSISLLVNSIYSNYLLLDSVLVSCMFLETCSFPLAYPICWHITVHNILLWLFIFLWYWLLFLPFISHFVYLGSLSFLLFILDLLTRIILQREISSLRYWSYKKGKIDAWFFPCILRFSQQRGKFPNSLQTWPMMFLFLKCNYELTDLNTFESQFKSLASEFFLTRF